jgi:hypothetical protein
MKMFKLATYRDNSGNWCFRWWNVNPSVTQALPLHQGLVGPCRDREEAEAEKRQFMEAEKHKHPWTVFESAE